MANLYSNLPNQGSQPSGTIRAFDLYNSAPLEFESTIYAACKGFFTNRGFHELAAESITVIILKQSKQDGYNPLKIIDTLRGLSDLELSSLVTELLNYNRLKTSSLGTAQIVRTNTEIFKNIDFYNGFYNPDVPLPISTYILRTRKLDYFENEEIKFRLETTNVKDGTILYYSITGTNITTSDFTTRTVSGPITVSSGTSEFYVTPLSDLTTEGTEYATVNIHPTSSLTNILTSTNFIISDSSKQPEEVYIDWTLVQSGLIFGYAGGWYLTNQGRLLRFNVQDSLNCGGINNQVQSGIATGTIVTSNIEYYVQFKITGVGEAEQENYERFDLYLNQMLVATGRSSGGGEGCAVNKPVKMIKYLPGPFLLTANSTHNITIYFTTGDGNFHVNSYYQVDTTFELA